MWARCILWLCFKVVAINLQTSPLLMTNVILRLKAKRPHGEVICCGTFIRVALMQCKYLTTQVIQNFHRFQHTLIALKI